MLDDFEPHAVLFGDFGGVRTGLALIDVGQFDGVAGQLPHVFGERGDLGTVPLIWRSHRQCEQMA